jgi:hypothetical protein
MPASRHLQYTNVFNIFSLSTVKRNILLKYLFNVAFCFSFSVLPRITCLQIIRILLFSLLSFALIVMSLSFALIVMIVSFPVWLVFLPEIKYMLRAFVLNTCTLFVLQLSAAYLALRLCALRVADNRKVLMLRTFVLNTYTLFVFLSAGVWKLSASPTPVGAVTGEWANQPESSRSQSKPRRARCARPASEAGTRDPVDRRVPMLSEHLQ